MLLNTWHALSTCRLVSWHVHFWQLHMIQTNHVLFWTWPGRLQTAAATTLPVCLGGWHPIHLARVVQLGLYFLFYRVMHCLLSIVVFNVPILCSVSLLTPFSSDRCSPPLIVERVKLYHPKVRVMSRYGGQRRDLMLEPVSGPISASLEGASIVSPRGLLAGLSLTY